MKYVYTALAALAIGCVVFFAGWHFKGNADASAIAKAEKTNTVTSTKIVTQYATKQAQAQIIYKTITQKVPYVETVYVQSKPVAYPVYVTVGFVSLYDAALLPTSAPAITTSSAPSQVTLTNVLSNHAENSSACFQYENELNALLQWGKQNQGWHVSS